MNKIINTLKASPIFALSRASTEVAHSNFWAWLIKLNKKFIRVFFPDEDVENFNDGAVFREQGHRDITLWTKDGQALVVENKIKSLSDQDQLLEYQGKLKTFKKGVTTGIIKPDFIDNCEMWQFVDYAEIGNRISTIAKSVELDEKDRVFINQYVDVIVNIEKLLTSVNKDVKTMSCDNLQPLEEIKFMEVAKKLRADIFVKYLQQTITQQAKSMVAGTGWDFVVLPVNLSASGDAIVDIRFVKNKDVVTVLGVQIEGKKFERDFLVEEVQNVNSMFNKCVDFNWFEKEQVVDGKNHYIFGCKTSMKVKPNFCKHEPKNRKYTHVYQYYDIQDYSFESLKDDILQHLLVASEIIKAGKI